MKPKERGIAWSPASAVRLHIDDIERLTGILSKVADPVRIEMPGYEDIRHPSDLSSLTEVIRTISLTGYERPVASVDPLIGPPPPPAIGIDFLPDDITIWASEDRPDLRGVLDEARHVLWDGARFAPPMALNLLWVPLLLLGIFGVQAGNDASQMLSTVLVVGFCGVVLFRVGLAVDRTRFTTIYPQYRDDHPSFWKRNGDALTVGLICTAFGLALGTLITILLQ